MNHNSIDEFNNAICEAMGSENEEYNNWVATTFGKRFAGVVANDKPIPYRCPCCGLPDEPEGGGVIATRRLNTAYVDDKRNWLTSCMSCFEKVYAEYEEFWSEYYATCF